MKINFWKLGLAIFFSWYFFRYAMHPGAGYFIDNANLAIHEAGHFIFSVFGQVIMVAGGSLMQIIVPIIFTWSFISSGQFFSGSLTLFWVGQNIINVSVYAGDAEKMALPLITGDPSTHDWHFLLDHFGLLSQTGLIASIIYFSGLIVLILAAILAIRFSLVFPKKPFIV
jgi:hypothetical protein